MVDKREGMFRPVSQALPSRRVPLAGGVRLAESFLGEERA